MDLNGDIGWDLKSYTDEFINEGLPEHRDARHALLHVMKATGKLAAAFEPLDHFGHPDFDPSAVAPYLADLVICAMRIAQTVPGMRPIDLEKAVAERLKRNVEAHA